MASDQTRVRFCNNHSPTKWIPSTYQADWYVTGDSSHLSQDGMDRFGHGLLPKLFGRIINSMA